jgi:hypothetical protein
MTVLEMILTLRNGCRERRRPVAFNSSVIHPAAAIVESSMSHFSSPDLI